MGMIRYTTAVDTVLVARLILLRSAVLRCVTTRSTTKVLRAWQCSWYGIGIATEGEYGSVPDAYYRMAEK